MKSGTQVTAVRNVNVKMMMAWGRLTVMMKKSVKMSAFEMKWAITASPQVLLNTLFVYLNIYILLKF